MPPRAWLILKLMVITIHYRHQHPLLIMLSLPGAFLRKIPWAESQNESRAHEAGRVSAACGASVPLFSDMCCMTSLVVTPETWGFVSSDKLKAFP